VHGELEPRKGRKKITQGREKGSESDTFAISVILLSPKERI
jgi:hypothetical protein